jgi:hypothetical protein
METLRSFNTNITVSSTTTTISMTRPILILICAMLLFHLPIVIYKIHLTFISVLYLCFCWDKSYKKPKIDPTIGFLDSSKNNTTVQDATSTTNTTIDSNTTTTIRKKTIYFVRHGESTWNDTFNKGKHRSTIRFIVGFIPNLIKANLYEIYLLLSGKMDRYGKYITLVYIYIPIFILFVYYYNVMIQINDN